MSFDNTDAFWFRESSKGAEPLPGTGLLAGLYYDPYPARFACNAKRMLERGLPLLVRLHPGARYPMDDDDLVTRVDPEGHVVALIGFDEEGDTVTVADPWDPPLGGAVRPVLDVPAREFFGIRIVDSTKDLCAAAVPLPLAVVARRIGQHGIEIEAEVSFALPAPLRCGAHALEDLCATIQLPSGLELVGGQELSTCGTLVTGEARKVSWSTRQVGPVAGEARVAVAGIAVGDEPYSFRDVIGSTTGLTVVPGGDALSSPEMSVPQRSTS